METLERIKYRAKTAGLVAVNKVTRTSNKLVTETVVRLSVKATALANRIDARQDAANAAREDEIIRRRSALVQQEIALNSALQNVRVQQQFVRSGVPPVKA